MKLPLFLLVLCTLALPACQTRTALDRRLDKHPELLIKLSDADRAAVMRGEISEGMSRDAVFLSWGRPDAVRSGSREGTKTEHWAYFGSVPVTTTSIGFNYGSSGFGYHPFYADYGVHPRYGYCSGEGWTFGTDVDYVTELQRSVEFRNDRVVAWQRKH